MRFILLAATLALGACSIPLNIVRQAEPNPFAGQAKFTLLPLEWAQWEEQNDRFTSRFNQALARAAEPVELVPSPTASVRRYTAKCTVRDRSTESSGAPGLGPARRARETTVQLQLLDPSGRVLEEVTAADDSAAALGGALGRYLLERTTSSGASAPPPLRTADLAGSD